MNTYTSRVLVVGTGAGGAVAAALLAQAGLDVVILEQGRSYEPEDHADVITSFTRMYVNGGVTLALGNPPIPIPLGKAVGGSTVINSSTCFRPSREKVEAWDCLDWDLFQTSLASVEERIHAVPADESLLGGNYTVLKRGCDALGVPIKPLVHNLDGCKKSGRCAFGCPTGAKQSMDRTYIPDAVAAGARLYAEHKVTGVLDAGEKLTGVTGISPDGPFEARADVIVLAMGALATPAFLLRHRLANSSGLVGRGLRIHPASRVAAEFDEIVDGDQGLPQGAYIDHWRERGIMLEGISLPPGPLLSGLPGAGFAFKELAARRRNIATFGVMVSDTGAGRVRRGFAGAPFTALYQLTQEDAENLRFAMVRLGELYFAAGAKRLFTNVAPMPVIASEAELREFERIPVKPGYFELMAFHPTGTCPMSVQPRNGVVNSFLRTYDLTNVYIMDGAVIPDALGVNPQLTIMGLAHRAATLLAERLQGA